MSESAVQHQIMIDLQRTGCYAIKVIAANRNGVPDIILCYHGRFIAIEVKDIKGRASALQAHNIERIKDAGGEAYVCKGLEGWKELKQIIFNKK